jgi:hypothetical protein
MITTESTSAPILTSVNSAPTSFKIKASARAFKILSGFYSDPLLAIPRELGANAWDSHVSCKNTSKMFEVHAPNTLEPWFSIRDFGTGLSANAIEQIYTTYFESTKTTDNDSDGCMGLGSKTPFNYTENFSVTSWFKGVKYIYNCFIDQSGVPSILKFGEEDSTEPNGVEVKFAVKSNDISMFVDKIRRAYAPFRFRPIIKGAVIEYPVIKHTFKGTNWSLREGDGRGYGTTSFAYMGNYSYPITVDSLFSGQDRYGNKDYDKVQKMLQYGSTELYFNIGDLEVAPNKEQLQYDADQKTQKAIIAAAVVAYDELVEQVQKNVEVPATYWEAMELYRKYSGYDSKFYNISRIIGNIPIKFNGKSVDRTEVYSDQLNESSGLKAKIPSGKSFGEHFGHFAVKVFKLNISNGQLRKVQGGCYLANNVAGSIFLFTNEVNLKRSRVRHYLQTTYSNVPSPTVHIIFDQTPKMQVWEAHKKFLGLKDAVCIDIEGLPIPPRKPRNPTTSKTDEIHYYTANMGYWSTKELTIDSKGTYYYIDYLYTDTVYNDKPINREVVNNLIAFGVKLKTFANSQEIYGINRKNKFMLKTGTWINVVDFLEKKVKSEEADLAHNLWLVDVYSPIVSNNHNLRRKISSSRFIDYLNRKATKELFEKFNTSSVAVIFDAQKISLARHYGIKAKKNSTFDSSLTECATLINDKYMNIFDMLDSYSVDSQKLAKIINFIDKNS